MKHRGKTTPETRKTRRATSRMQVFLTWLADTDREVRGTQSMVEKLYRR